MTLPQNATSRLLEFLLFFFLILSPTFSKRGPRWGHHFYYFLLNLLLFLFVFHSLWLLLPLLTLHFGFCWFIHCCSFYCSSFRVGLLTVFVSFWWWVVIVVFTFLSCAVLSCLLSWAFIVTTSPFLLGVTALGWVSGRFPRYAFDCWPVASQDQQRSHCPSTTTKIGRSPQIDTLWMSIFFSYRLWPRFLYLPWRAGLVIYRRDIRYLSRSGEKES